MKVKYAVLLSSINALNELITLKMPAKTALVFYKLVTAINVALEPLRKMREDGVLTEDVLDEETTINSDVVISWEHIESIESAITPSALISLSWLIENANPDNRQERQ